MKTIKIRQCTKESQGEGLTSHCMIGGDVSEEVTCRWAPSLEGAAM